MSENSSEQKTVGVESLLSPGDYITLYNNLDIDYKEDGKVAGSSVKIMFEGEVNRLVPETGLIEFCEESRTEDIGRAKLQRYIDECDGFEILRT